MAANPKVVHEADAEPGKAGRWSWPRRKHATEPAVSPTNVVGVWRARGVAVDEFALPGATFVDDYIPRGGGEEEGCRAGRAEGATVESADGPGLVHSQELLPGTLHPTQACGGEPEGTEEDARYAAARMAFALSEARMDLALSLLFVQRVAQLALQHGPSMECPEDIPDSPLQCALTTEYSEAARPPEHRRMQRARQELVRLHTSAANVDALLASPAHCSALARVMVLNGYLPRGGAPWSGDETAYACGLDLLEDAERIPGDGNAPRAPRRRDVHDALDEEHGKGRYMRLAKVLMVRMRGLWWMRRLLVNSGLLQRKLSAAPVRPALQRCKAEPKKPKDEDKDEENA